MYPDTIVKLADILQVSLDELAGRKEPSPELKIRNYELQRLCQQCDELPDEDQQALIVMMDSSHMTKGIAKAAARYPERHACIRQAPRRRGLGWGVLRYLFK